MTAGAGGGCGRQLKMHEAFIHREGHAAGSPWICLVFEALSIWFCRFGFCFFSN